MRLRRRSIPLFVLGAVLLGPMWLCGMRGQAQATAPSALQGQSELPDAPGFHTVDFYGSDSGSGLFDPAEGYAGVTGAPRPPMPPLCVEQQARERYMPPEAAAALDLETPCVKVNPFKLFLDSPLPITLSARQKGRLALHNFLDPFNLLTIAGNSAFTIGTNAHTAYGPGWTGFGSNVGYSLAQDATGNFVAVFAIASIAHQDPHYYRMPRATIPRRVLHAVSNAVIGQSDSGHAMPNYMVLLGYPICIEITNAYVPGVNGSLPASVERFATGLATEPIGNLITEFLPDVASRIHIRVLFVQRILNQVAAGQPTPP
jgi:hypothetical protein